MQINKYYYDSNASITQMKYDIAQYKAEKQKYADTKFVIVIDQEQAYANNHAELFSNINEAISEGLQPQDIVVGINGCSFRYKTKQWEQIKKLRDKLQSKNIAFGFEDSNNTWNIDDVESANKQIVEIADNIRRKHLSPFEMLIVAHDECLSKEYVEEQGDEHWSQSRSVYGVLNSDRIVCVGYSTLLSGILQEIDNKNIKCYINRVATSDDNKFADGLHANVVVYIKDDKYGIDGYYYIDPTWNAAVDVYQRLTFFMVPLGQIKNFCDPYIRDPNVIPDDKELAEAKQRKQKEDKQDHVKNRPGGGYIAFTQDRFRYSVEFLKDYYKMFPEIAENIKKLAKNDEVTNAENLFEVTDKEKNFIVEVNNALKNKNVPISKMSLGKIYTMLNKAIKAQDYSVINLIDEFILQNKQQTSNNTAQEAIDVVLNSAISKQNRALQSIEQKENEIYTPEILAHLQMQVSGVDSSIENSIIKNSKPIELEKMIVAIKTAYKAMHPTMLDSDIDDLTHKTLLESAKLKSKIFNNFKATNDAEYLMSSQFGEN